jgi:hypothetical protein
VVEGLKELDDAVVEERRLLLAHAWAAVRATHLLSSVLPFLFFLC